METSSFKKLIEEIGFTVHSMNTIAVALSVMAEKDVDVPVELDISWKPSDIYQSKVRARNFAKKSTYVYVAENLFEYLRNISKNPFWKYPDINFKSNDPNSDKVYNFLIQIPELKKEMIILVELLCHWRNRIVHEYTSNAGLSSNKRDFLLERKDLLYDELCHFDSKLALENFQNKTVTLKDVSTLTTIVISCCRKVDEYFLRGIADYDDLNQHKDVVIANAEFNKIYLQPISNKRSRQIRKWLNLNYNYIDKKKIEELCLIFEKK